MVVRSQFLGFRDSCWFGVQRLTSWGWKEVMVLIMVLCFRVQGSLIVLNPGMASPSSFVRSERGTHRLDVVSSTLEYDAGANHVLDG